MLNVILTGEVIVSVPNDDKDEKTIVIFKPSEETKKFLEERDGFMLHRVHLKDLGGELSLQGMWLFTFVDQLKYHDTTVIVLTKR